MAGLDRRLDRLEDRQEPERREPSEEERKRHWLATARARLAQDRHPTEWHVWGVIRLLKMQGRLPDTTEGLRDRLLTWRPPLDERDVERVLARAIHDGEPGTEAMARPPEWRESFEAAEELRERYGAVPDEVLARWALWQHETEEGVDPDVEERLTREADAHGITEELILKAVGPDAEEIGEEESPRRMREILGDVWYSEKCYRIKQHIDRHIEARSNA